MVGVTVVTMFSTSIRILIGRMHSAKTVFPLDTQETRRGEGGRLKSASLSFLLALTSFLSLSLSLSVLNALQSLYLPQGACPFFYFSLLSACSVILTQLCVYICVYMCVCVCFFFCKCDRMRIYLSFVISFVAADWLLLLLLLLLALFLFVLF